MMQRGGEGEAKCQKGFGLITELKQVRSIRA